MNEIVLIEIADTLKDIRGLLENQNQLLAENQQWRDKFANEIAARLPDLMAKGDGTKIIPQL